MGKSWHSEIRGAGCMEEGCGPVSLRERDQEEVTGALRRKRTEADI